MRVIHLQLLSISVVRLGVATQEMSPFSEPHMRLAPLAAVLSLFTIAGCAPPPTPEQLSVMERIKTKGFSSEEKRVIARAFLQGIGHDTLTGLWIYPVKDGLVGPSGQSALIRFETNKSSVFSNAEGCFNLFLSNGRVILMSRAYTCAKNTGEESIMDSVQEAKRELAAELLRLPPSATSDTPKRVTTSKNSASKAE